MAKKKAAKKVTKKKTSTKKASAPKKKQTLEDIEKTLWKAADKLRVNMDAAEYKHVVLGLIFLKYVSDSFDEFRENLKKELTDPEHDHYYEGASEEDIEAELEDRDYYKSNNIFWVPQNARWHGNKVTGHQGIQDKAKQSDIGKTIDDAMEAIEKDNSKLKNVLPKDFARRQPNIRLGELVDLISTIGFNDSEHHSKDVLGHVYEYFLGQFASAEGKKGGQFYTPKSVVNLIVECLEPYEGRVYDPAMGSGGFFVSSERFIEAHTDKKHIDEAKRKIALYGQESNPTTWRLSAMNMAIRGIDFNFGKKPADTFSQNQHPDLKADFVMANPPFNMSDWGGEKLVDDRRWKYGVPPEGNANFAWLQHIIHHLSINGTAGIVLANGSVSSNVSNEGDIRRRIVEERLVDCMIALPDKLFFNTPIPACIWILSKNKAGDKKFKKRENEILFIDAQKMGTMISKTQRILSQDELAKVANTYNWWRTGDKKYKSENGFCKSGTIDDVKSNGFILTPSRYIDASVCEDMDTVSFEERMSVLSDELGSLLSATSCLEKEIRSNLKGIGYEL